MDSTVDSHRPVSLRFATSARRRGGLPLAETRDIYASRWHFIRGGTPLVIDTDRHGRIPLGCLTTASMKGRDETMLNAMDDVVEASFNQATSCFSLPLPSPNSPCSFIPPLWRDGGQSFRGARPISSERPMRACRAGRGRREQRRDHRGHQGSERRKPGPQAAVVGAARSAVQRAWQRRSRPHRR